MKSLLQLLRRTVGDEIKFSELQLGDKYQLSWTGEYSDRLLVYFSDTRGISWIENENRFVHFTRNMNDETVWFKGTGEVTKELEDSAKIFYGRLFGS